MRTALWGADQKVKLIIFMNIMRTLKSPHGNFLLDTLVSLPGDYMLTELGMAQMSRDLLAGVPECVFTVMNGKICILVSC